MIFIMKFTKGHNSVNNVVQLQFLSSASRLIMFYIYTKFRENILNGLRFIEQT